MGNCDGPIWFSTVNNLPDGILDFDGRVHHKQGGGDEGFQMVCGRNLILINKTGHVYMGILISDGFYQGTKLSRRQGKKPFDEPTDGTWTAEKGPGQEGDDKGRNAAKKTAKATTKRASKVVKRSINKAAKSGRKK